MALASCNGKGSANARPAPSASALGSVASVASVVRQPQAVGVSSAESSAPAPSTSSAVIAAPAPGRPPASRADACHPLKGPIQLSFTGAATVLPSDDGGPDQDPRIVFNRDGVPKAVTLPSMAAPKIEGSAKVTAGKPAAKVAAKSERLALAEPAEAATAPGCALAGSSLFCMAANGDLHRTTRNGEGDVVLAKARPGTPIAASTLGVGRTAYAFLADRKTSEGVMSLAFAALDEGAPVQLSEDGSGATFVALAPRGEQAVAMYIDGRRAMTPLHARVLSAEPGRMRLGGDAVLFVGEGSETRVSGALVLGESGPAFGLLPGFKDATTFGMAAIRIDDQPHDDAPVTWSTYPSGMDRAAIAATHGVSPRRVLLARPATSDAKGKKVLELGEIEDTGAFKGLCAVAEGPSFGDLGLRADRFGTLWLTYTDAEGTWIERRGKAF